MGRDTSESDSDVSACHKISDLEDHLLQRKRHNESKCHKCDHEGCGKSFYRPSKLEAHKRLHQGQRPFMCSHEGCGKAYTNSSHLKRHVKVSHEKSQVVNLFICPEQGCEAELRTRQNLKKHIKRRHTHFPYECPDCKAKFKRNHHLKEHSFVHTGVPPFVCETCKKGFQKSYELKKHQRCHRTYTCGLQNCSATFPSMSLYRKHMATTHKPDYECVICDKRFSSRTNLKSHFFTHMDLETLKCPNKNCQAVFSQERYLKQHMENVHGLEHEYKCPVEDCQKVFKWKRSLVHHVKLHSMKKSKKLRKAQKERKDKGQPKKSMAAELANVTLTEDIHKELLSKEQETLVERDIAITPDVTCVEHNVEDKKASNSENIFCNSEIIDIVEIGKEIFYRIENISVEIASDCSILENSADCDAN